MKGSDELRDTLDHIKKGTITDLSLIGYWDDESVAILVEALQNNVSITSVDLGQILCGLKVLQGMRDAMKRNTTLTRFLARGTEIGNEGAVLIADAFSTGTSSLTIVDLGDDGIGLEGALAIGEALKCNRMLKILSLRGNALGADGARCIGEGLSANVTLEVLDIGRNGIGEEGCVGLGMGLKHNQTLKQLNLWDNLIGIEGARAIGISICSSTSLTSLDIGFNQMDEVGVKVLCDLLAETKQISEKLEHWLQCGWSQWC